MRFPPRQQEPWAKCTQDDKNKQERPKGQGAAEKAGEPRVWPEDSLGMPLTQRSKSLGDFCTAIASGLSREQEQGRKSSCTQK